MALFFDMIVALIFIHLY